MLTCTSNLPIQAADCLLNHLLSMSLSHYFLVILNFFFFLNVIRVQPFGERLVTPAALEWREEEAASLVSHTAEFLGLGCRQAVHGNLAIASR